MEDKIDYEYKVHSTDDIKTQAIEAAEAIEALSKQFNKEVCTLVSQIPNASGGAYMDFKNGLSDVTDDLVGDMEKLFNFKL
jgi:hypothetical protein